MRLWLSFLFIIFLSTPAAAEEFIFSPEGCEFRMIFPDEPYVTKRCHDKMQDKCTLMTSFTKVFELDATVNFYVSCSPSESSLRESFTPDLMRTTLLARPKIDSLEVYDITYDESETAARAALLGAGRTENGNDILLYVTQLWVGKNSVLTLEGELIGEQSEEVDQFFGMILGSLSEKNLPKATSDDDAEEETDSAE